MITLVSRVLVKLYRNSTLIKELKLGNTWTNIGITQLIRQHLYGDSGKAVAIGIGWGDGSDTAPDPSQSNLQGTGQWRKLATQSYTDGEWSYTLSASFTFSEETTVNEAGIFASTDSDNDDMFSRTTFSLTIQPEDELIITWTVQFSEAT